MSLTIGFLGAVFGAFVSIGIFAFRVGRNIDAAVEPYSFFWITMPVCAALFILIFNIALKEALANE